MADSELKLVKPANQQSALNETEEVAKVDPRLSVVFSGTERRISQPPNEDEFSKQIRSESHVLIPRELSLPEIDHGELDDIDKEEDAVVKQEFDVTDMSMMDDYYEESVEEEEQEEEQIEEEEESTITEESDQMDKEEYVEHYKKLVIQYMAIKAKNLFLQRKMAEYFKRRKMEHVLRETDQIADNLAKYHKKLALFYELRESNLTERNRIVADISLLRGKRDEQLENVTKDFKAIQKREKEIGTGLIYTKTGRQIPEKFLERLLWHQVNKTEEMAKMRKKYNRLRDAVAEKQQQIRALDKIGDNHTLIDYEQLKMENQSHADKIEERDEELARLRVTCSSAIECLAHIREKCVANGQQIQESKMFLASISERLLGAREKVNKIKFQRDSFRMESRKLKQQSGLLTKPKLLRDMEDAVTEVNVYMKELEEIQEKYEHGRKRLEILKKNVTIAKKETVTVKKTAEKQEHVKLYKGRPSLMVPMLPTEKTINYINI